MEEKKVTLTWTDKSLEFWSGNKFGRDVYNEQARSQIDSKDLQEKIVIEFPFSIKFLNWSFVQGFFNDILHQINGKENFKQHVRITSADPQKSDLIEKMVLQKLKIQDK